MFRVILYFFIVFAHILFSIPVAVSSAEAYPYESFFITQIVNHDCGAPCGTFSQRVIFNVSLALGIEDPPLILLVGGENDVGTWWNIMGYEAYSLAAADGAVIAALEHRYFGSSFPQQPPSLANLSTLDPAIAAKDVFSALPLIIGNIALLSDKSRVVLLGCSYSGTVAAYSQDVPGVKGIYASSTPVQPLVEFESYHVTMAEALGDPAAGGSPPCSALVTSALQNASKMMATGAFVELAEAWGSCDPITRLDDARFMFYQTVDLAFGVTYVQENAEIYIPYVCNFLSNAVDHVGLTPAEAWQQLLVNVTWAYPAGCTIGGGTGSWVSYIAQIALPNATYAGSNTTRDDRQWWYLQCAHLGWLHTCTSSGGCPYAAPGIDFDPLPSSWYEELCRGAFGLGINDTAKGVAALETLAAGSMSSSNIFAINGNDDPWHVLGLLPPPSTARILVEGGWHCSDMSQPSLNDPQGLVEARQAVSAQVHSWLTTNDDDSSSSSSNNSKSSTLSEGAIVGIAIAGVVVIIAAGVFIFRSYKKKFDGTSTEDLLLSNHL